MNYCIKTRSGCVSPVSVSRLRSTRLSSARPASMRRCLGRTRCAAKQSDSEAALSDVGPLLSIFLGIPLLSTWGPALAEEETAVLEKAAEATEKTTSILGFTPEGLLLVFSPLVVYSVFFVYRATINPKAKLNDLLFIAAACVVVGNIASILLFKKRIY
eukprot:jgi/Picsp_1/6776/NSC_04116-R1_hypothetical protein CHLREDRAFT_187840 [Chlamydomonas reinhardtii]